MTIRLRLILAVAAIQTLFIVALMGSIVTFGERMIDQRLHSQAEAKAQLAALLVAGAVAAGDASAARDLAAKMVAGGSVRSIQVFDRAGARLAEAHAPKTASSHVIRASRTVLDGARVVGLVTVERSSAFADQAMAETKAKLVLVGGILLLLSATASWVIGSVIGWRLDALRRSADAIAAGRFDHPFDAKGPPDVVAVAAAMNAMARRLGDLYAGINADLDRRKRTLASTFQHMTQGVAIFDADGRLVEANAAFPDLIGLPAAALVPGVTLDGLVDLHAAAGAYADGDEGARMEALCRSREWLGPSLAFELPFPDDRTVAVRRTRLPDGGFIAIHEDITRRRQDERRLLHAAKLTTLGRLATAAAHELNQPLNVIRLSADNAAARVADGVATAEYLAEKLQRISLQTERAARIIDHMRIFGRKPAGDPTPFDLGEAVRSAADFFAEQARLRGLRLDLRLEPGLVVRGHAALIEQVAANILSNAFAALETGGQADAAVTVCVARQGGRARVEIADNAGGIPAAVLSHIFEPFFTTKSDRDGTGLGLSISYGIVADMGGRLEAWNEGGGAVFAFELPMSDGRPDAETSVSAAADRRGADVARADRAGEGARTVQRAENQPAPHVQIAPATPGPGLGVFAPTEGLA